MARLNIDELGAETSLLLQCAKVYLSTGYPEQIIQLLKQAKLNWVDFINIAQFHRLLPILHNILSALPAEEIPDWVHIKFRQIHLETIKRNFSLLKELTEFLDILDIHRIKAITFKGPMVAMVGYGDLALRTFYDLDLLVHPDEFFKLRDIAISHGYQCDRLMAESERNCLEKLNPTEQALYFKSQKEYSLYHPKKKIFLDIHQGILSKQFSPLFDTRWLWHHTQIVDIGGRQILGLTPEIQLLILCSQGAEDCWIHLGKVFDVAILISKHPTLNWSKLTELTKQKDIFPRLLLGLSLVQDLYGIMLPDNIQKELKHRSDIQTLAMSVKKILFKTNYNPGSNLRLTHIVYQLKMMNSWKNRRHFIYTLMNPTLADIAAISLPKSLFFIYYLLRPFRLIRQVFGMTA